MFPSGGGGSGAYSLDPLGTGNESDKMEVIPLGAGCEVGRSCCVVRFKGKTVMFDCGVHPAYSGMASLPFFDADDVNLDDIDLCLITHFHLDHCAALPYLLEKTNFNPKARIFMTHPTKAIYKDLLTDFIRVSHHSQDENLYSEQDIFRTMERIEPVEYHQEKNVNGIRFWGYNAGHVLGAAMFMIEIAGVRVLYTGDFSRQEDRHLKEAEVPPFRPDVIVIESTYGVQTHDSRRIRENRFTQKVAAIVRRGGRVLLPVFALGRAQELLLILDEYWEAYPDLQKIPIYYASALAKRCMHVYKTYIYAMNDHIRRRFDIANPFAFKYVSNLKNIDSFDDRGPCVVMASPGMLQSGLSRELFERWCTDKRNGVILPGYTVDGTLGDKIKKEPSTITRSDGREVPMNCSVDYITFSAHSDYKQTTDFIDAVKPTNIILVHGEVHGMAKLKQALDKKYNKANERPIRIFTPSNGQAVDLHFQGEKVGKAIDVLPKKKLEDGMRVDGIMIRQDFSHTLLKPEDLNKYTSLKISKIAQKQVVPLRVDLEDLVGQLRRTFVNVKHWTDEKTKVQKVLVVDAVRLSIPSTQGHAVLEWSLNHATDMVADCVSSLCVGGDGAPKELTNMEVDLKKEPNIASEDDKMIVDEKEGEAQQFLEEVVSLSRRLLSQRFGPVYAADGELTKSRLVVDLFEVSINHESGQVECEDDGVRERVRLALQRINATVFPIPDFYCECCECLTGQEPEEFKTVPT